MKTRNSLTSIHTALIYAGFGALWILVSDKVLEFLVSPASPTYILIQTLKGWLFVLASASLIYLILLRDMRSLQERQKHINYQAGLIEDVSDAIISTDMQFHILSWNHAAESMYGWKATEVIGHVLREFVQNEYINVSREEITKTALEQGIWKGEVIQNNKNGGRFFVSTSLSWVKSQDGQPIGLVAINRDITELKEGEEALRASEDRYRDLVDHSQDLICTHDLEGRILSVNPWASQRLGYLQNTLLQMNLRDIIAPEFRDRFNLYLAVIQRRKFAKGEMVFLTLTGERRIWEFNNTLRTEGVAMPIVRGMAHDITERKRAEQALQASEQAYAALLKNLSGAVYRSRNDKDRTVEYISEGCTLLTGYAPQEIIESRVTSLGAIMHPEDVEPVWKKCQINLAAHKACSNEYRIIHRDGAFRWVWDQAQGIYSDSGELMFIEGLLTNITERKQVEEKFFKSEAKLRSLLAAMQDVVLIIDKHGMYREIAPTNPDLLVRPSAELLGQFLQNIFPAGQAGEFLKVIETVLNTQRARQIEYQFEIRGKQFWFSAVITPMTEDLTVWVARDITERKGAEEKIKKQLNHLKALHEIDMAITSGSDLHLNLAQLLNHVQKELGVDAASILILDPKLQILEYGGALGFRATGLEMAQVPLNETYAGHVAKEHRIVQILNVKDEPDSPFITKFLADEGLVCYFGAPLIARGKIMGVLEVFHRSPLNPDQEWFDFLNILAGQAAIAIEDAQLINNLQRAKTELEQRVAERTAELHQTNAELERANRAKDEFLASMSHELRTPLNSILGLSESLLEQRRGSLNDDQQKSLQIIESSGRHLLELITDILDLSKIEAGKFDYYPQFVNVDELCRSSLSFVKNQAIRKSINLNYNNETSVPGISADPRRLKQILVNLLTNAVKFTPAHGQVSLEVRADPEKELIQFSVIDSGIGIAPEDLKRLFTPFVQLDSGLNRQFEGTGLGLALTQKLTDLHGGSIQVESEVGKGSRFTINLHCKQGVPEQLDDIRTHNPPAVDEQNERVDFQPAGKGAATHYKILLAEDNEANVLTVAEYLENHGYEVLVAHDGLEAIAMTQETDPHVILMDIQMPIMNGLEAIQRLRNDPRFASTPIIALTSLALAGDRERCLQAGATEYMSKPVRLKALRKMIETFLKAGN